jgi:hypothetical protein
MSNIFLLSPNLTKKERFAASWEYLLENIQDLGQEFVDFLTQRSGQASSKFIGAVHNAFLAAAIKPDLLLHCQDFDIICSHLLESELTHHSLDNLLVLARFQSKNTYVALITNSYCLIEPEILASENAKRYYLQPQNYSDSSMPYFCWQDIYALVAQRQERLAHEFTEYMHFMDMQPWQHSTWGNLFLSPELAKKFSEQWGLTLDYFHYKDIAIAKHSGYNALEINYPLPWLQLLYIYTTRSVSHNDLQSISPYLVATVWIKGDDRDQIRAFRGISDSFTLQGHDDINIEIRASLADGLWMIKSTSRPKLAATYYTSLDRVASKDLDKMQQNLLAFTQAIITHAKSLEVS